VTVEYAQISLPVAPSSARNVVPFPTNITPLTTIGTAVPPAACCAHHAGTSEATFVVLICLSGEYRVAA
jgi:hypothetical protein